MLIVNVASRCGLTPQYSGLEALQRALRRARLHRARCPLQPVRGPRARIGRGDRDLLLNHLRSQLPDDRETRSERVESPSALRGSRHKSPTDREKPATSSGTSRSSSSLPVAGPLSVSGRRPNPRLQKSSRPSSPCCRAECSASPLNPIEIGSHCGRCKRRSHGDTEAHHPRERASVALFRKWRSGRATCKHIQYQGDADLEPPRVGGTHGVPTVAPARRARPCRAGSGSRRTLPDTQPGPRLGTPARTSESRPRRARPTTPHSTNEVLGQPTTRRQTPPIGAQDGTAPRA